MFNLFFIYFLEKSWNQKIEHITNNVIGPATSTFFNNKY